MSNLYHIHYTIKEANRFENGEDEYVRADSQEQVERHAEEFLLGQIFELPGNRFTTTPELFQDNKGFWNLQFNISFPSVKYEIEQIDALPVIPVVNLSSSPEVEKPAGFAFNPAFDHTILEVATGHKVAFQNEKSGISIFVEGYEYAVAFIDFYYLDNPKECQDQEPAPQITIYDPVELDPVSHIMLEPKGARVSFETGVKIVKLDKNNNPVWGYLGS